MWNWAKPGIQIPSADWDEFERRIVAMYGAQNKGRRKWLYTLAFRLLLSLDDRTIKSLAHQIEGEALDVAADTTPEGAADQAAGKLRRAGRKRSTG